MNDCNGCRKKLCLNEDDCLSLFGSESIARCVVQEYVDKPLLIAGAKSHLRLYVLITSSDPLRVFLYDDCLLHLAGDKYVSPAADNLVSYTPFTRSSKHQAGLMELRHLVQM